MNEHLFEKCLDEVRKAADLVELADKAGYVRGWLAALLYCDVLTEHSHNDALVRAQTVETVKRRELEPKSSPLLPAKRYAPFLRPAAETG